MANLRAYTDKELLDRMRSLPSFTQMPKGFHLIVVRSDEGTDTFDDKAYLFKGETFVEWFSCTSHSGLYGLKNFLKWNKKGTAVIKFNEVYYNAFIKSDGVKYRHHNGKMQCLRQIGDLKYYRDNNFDDKIDESGPIYVGNYATNVHANSYKFKRGIINFMIGRWSVGCTVINNLTKYWNILMLQIPYNHPVTYTGLKEF